MKKRFLELTLISLLIFSVLFMTGCQAGNAYKATKTAGKYIVTLQMNHNPPVAGKNEATVNVKDQSGNAVTDAKVIVEYSMPAMPGMPAMNHKADTVLEGKAYKTTIDLMMSGSWTITTKINRAGKIESARFTVDAR